MLDRAENLLHDHYGGKEYWDVSAAGVSRATSIVCFVCESVRPSRTLVFRLAV